MELEDWRGTGEEDKSNVCVAFMIYPILKYFAGEQLLVCHFTLQPNIHISIKTFKA